MQRIGSLLASQILVLLFVGSYGWLQQPSNGADNYDSMKRLMYSYGTFKRLPSYDFGLGKRSLEEPASYEDLSSSGPAALPELYYVDNNGPAAASDKRAPGNMYSFGLGKRNRAYGFGLGKRLEQAWKEASSNNYVPAYSRQERRSKIYSFGLGKRSGHEGAEDYMVESPASDKRASGRQFSFGLGKREAVMEDGKAAKSSANSKSES